MEGKEGFRTREKALTLFFLLCEESVADSEWIRPGNHRVPMG